MKNFHDKENYWKITSDNTLDVFWAKNKILFLIACLLHDVGHAPFSHALEVELHRNSGTDFDLNLKNAIEALEKHSISDSEFIKLSRSSEHERIGARLIIDHYKIAVRNILESFENYPNYVESSLFAEHFVPPPIINSDDLDSDLAFIVRMILGVKYTSYEPELQIRNCFIDLLNGSNFDVDKLDYILRDTAMSGISNIGIDVQRLIGAINIVPLTEYRATTDAKTLHNFSKNTLLQNISAEKSGIMHMSGSISGIFSLPKGAKMVVRGNITIVEMRTVADHYSEILVKGVSYFEDLKETEIILGNDHYSATEVTDGCHAIVITGSENSNKSCIIKNARLQHNQRDTKFEFTVVSGRYFVEISGVGEIQIAGAFKNMTPISLENSENDAELRIQGEGMNLTVLGDRLVDEIPTQTAFNSFAIGYHKQAINVISNVLDARDYLYLWIYAHHKVVYYANYLIPALATHLLKPPKKPKKQIISHPLSYSNIRVLDDALMWTRIREAQFQKNNNADVDCLVTELLSRKYKKSLLKSLAEFDILLDVFTSEEKQRIFLSFQKEIDTDLSVGTGSSKSAGKLNRAFIEELCASIGINHTDIGDLVWIDASYTKKKIDANSTFIIFPNVTTVMSQIKLLNTEDHANTNAPYYFYLYYSNESCNMETLEILRHGIVQYFQSEIGKQRMDDTKNLVSK